MCKISRMWGKECVEKMCGALWGSVVGSSCSHCLAASSCVSQDGSKIPGLASSAAEIGFCWPSFSSCQNSNSLSKGQCFLVGHSFSRKTWSPLLVHCFCITAFHNAATSNSCNLTARCGNFFLALQADCKAVLGCYCFLSRWLSKPEGKESLGCLGGVFSKLSSVSCCWSYFVDWTSVAVL